METEVIKLDIDRKSVIDKLSNVLQSTVTEKVIQHKLSIEKSLDKLLMKPFDGRLSQLESQLDWVSS